MKRGELVFYIIEGIVIIALFGIMVTSFIASQPKVPDGPIGVVIGDNIARGPSGRLQSPVNLSKSNEYGSWAYGLENATKMAWYNQAISNANTTNVLDRWKRDVLGQTDATTTYYSSIPEKTLPKKPSYVVVIVGKNDILDNVPNEIIKNNFVAMAESARENNISAVFCTVPPSAALNSSKLLELNAWMKVTLPRPGVTVWDAYTFFNDPRKINVLAPAYDDSTHTRPSVSAVDQAAQALWRGDPLNEKTATELPIGVVIGDLLARGPVSGRLSHPVALGTPNQFGSWAYEFENQTGWLWYNQGIPSTNTTNLLSRWERDALGRSSYAPPYYSDMPNMTLPKKPSCIVIIVGRNDLAENTPTATIKGNLQAMAVSAQRNHITVVFCTIPPSRGISTTAQFEINQWMKATLPRYGAIVWDMHAYFTTSSDAPRVDAVFDEFGHIRLSADGIDRTAIALWRDSLRAAVQ